MLEKHGWGKKKKTLTGFEKTCPVVVYCSWPGMSGGDVKQGPVGMPAPPGQPDSLAWTVPSSGQITQTAEETPQ